MRRTLAIRSITFSLCCSPMSSQATEWWVEAASRETQNGPALTVTGAEGFEITLLPNADAPLLEYLGNRSFGSLPRLPIGLQDKNRSLIRFEIPPALRGIAIEKAELVLDIHMGGKAPRAAVEIAVHAVESPWTEARVNWHRHPGFRDTPAQRVKLEPRPARVTIDLTELTREWATGKLANHGILLKPQLGIAASAGVGLARRLLALLPFETNAAKALTSGRAAHRLVLTFVRPAYRPTNPDATEELLMATVFTDPRLAAIVRHRFVPLRLSYVPTIYTHGKRTERDPLRAIGGDATQIKAPALCVSTPDGELVDSLQSIGTFDPELIAGFLLRTLADSKWSRTTHTDPETCLLAGELQRAEKGFRALQNPQRDYGLARIAALRGEHNKARTLAHGIDRSSYRPDARVQEGVSAMRTGDFAAARTILAAALRDKPNRSAEALYWLACLDRRSLHRATGDAKFVQLRKDHPSTPWRIRADARLAWPDRMDPAEPLRIVPGVAAIAPSTERPAAEAGATALVERAVTFLLEQQRPDGTWPCEIAMYAPAINALAAKAVETWIPLLADPPLRNRAVAGSAKALGWIRTYINAADSKEANSFGTAYILDYALARLARPGSENSTAMRETVQAAVRLLMAGQCPNGAWSYSYDFGTKWRGGFGGWPKTTRGRVHSVNTGPALVFLHAAKARGFAIDPAAIKRGVDVLNTMRAAAGVYTYTHPDPVSFRRIDQSIARGPVCEQALFQNGRVPEEDLAAALRSFMRFRAGLRKPAKLDKSWATPNSYSSYFYFYAHYHAALAAKALGTKAAAPILAAIREEILTVAEADATWIDFRQIGKPYGTAMALLLLAMTRPQ